jgi:hypothetical protein
VGLSERFLKGMQVIHRPQPFDGLNLVAVRLHGKHQAGADCLSIEDDGARATHAVLATDVRAGQAKFVTQEIAQQQTRLDGTPVLGAIYSNSYIEQVTHNSLLTNN